MSKIIRNIITALMFFFLYAPIALLILFSFNESKNRFNFTGFSLKWYIELFKDDVILDALKVTIIVAVISAIIATVIGTAAAIGIFSMKKFPKSVVMNITYIPVVSPDIITGVSLMLLFAFVKFLPLGIVTLTLAHITFNIPYVILSVMPKLRQLNKHTTEAALDLGATPLQAIFKVVIPEIMPGIISGLVLAFTLSIDDFVISYFTSGTTQNLPMAIFSMTRKPLTPEINALSTIMFAVVLSLLLIVNINQKETKQIKTGG